MLKVTGEGGIMDEHMKTAEEKDFVWYSYFGNPAAKPSGKTGLNDVYFIEQDKLYHGIISEIFNGPTQGGNDLNKNMIPFIPEKYQEDIITHWDECAFSLKVENINLLRTISDLRLPIQNMYYERNDKPFIPKKAGIGGAFFIYLRKKPEEEPEEDVVNITIDLIEKALKELGKIKASKNELIPKLKEIVERNGGVLVDDETAWKEIQNLNDKSGT